MAFYIQGQSLVEMAERLDAPLGTIKRRLHTARKRLKAELEAVAADAEEWSDGAGSTTTRTATRATSSPSGPASPARW